MEVPELVKQTIKESTNELLEGLLYEESAMMAPNDSPREKNIWVAASSHTWGWNILSLNTLDYR